MLATKRGRREGKVRGGGKRGLGSHCKHGGRCQFVHVPPPECSHSLSWHVNTPFYAVSSLLLLMCLILITIVPLL